MKATYRRAGAFGLALAVLSFAAGPVQAASKEIERLLIQVANLQLQVADLHRLVGENAKEIKRLADNVGEQNAALRKTLQDQKLHEEALQATLKEMTERLSEVTTAAASPSTTSAAPPTAGGDPAAAGATPLPGPNAPPAMDLLSQAYADCRRGNYDLGVQGLREFLRIYPNTDRSDNAQYWIGECLFGKESFAEAVGAWDVLLRDFPSSDKIADARVKKGMALERLGQKKEAMILYRYVLEHYPNSEAAKVAKNKLNPQ
jgi:tol-pal system protein YbgF